MNKSLLESLFAYKAWSDARIASAARALEASVAGNSLSFIRQQINHVVRVEELFRARLLGSADPHSSTNTDDVPELNELLTRLEVSNLWYASYLQSLSVEQLDEMIRFRFTDGQSGSLSRVEVLFHVVNHSTYHRGAIGRVLDESPVARPADTYTVFIHAAQPTRRLG